MWSGSSTASSASISRAAGTWGGAGSASRSRASLPSCRAARSRSRVPTGRAARSRCGCPQVTPRSLRKSVLSGAQKGDCPPRSRSCASELAARHLPVNGRGCSASAEGPSRASRAPVNSRGHGMEHLLKATAERASRYRESLHDRNVAPSPEAVANLRRLDEPLRDTPTDPEAVIALLDEVGSPATMATAGGRFFGFVVGSSLPATVAANWLAGAWDQNAGLVALSPIAAKLEEVAMCWMLDLLGLPAACGAGFVTCATQANFAGLAAGRHALLARQGWDVETQGLFGAPPINVVVSEQVHVSVLKALALLGLGRERVIHAPVDGQGRIRSDALPPLDADTIVCLQAGDVNTGAFDPAAEIIPRARAAGAWVHVDGAFGLWAAAAPASAHLMDGIPDAGSWA